ncbi:hypothetical protein JOB18_038149 [Solea senegalensis]|uniref:Uncharacterized protein n=1 Tax=Solea senegalensis TaxID=28829 RepID=A0AAV6QNR8_SOLSE|nr:hypothetical protein JOB18_038149 [Solea senegalensis]
MAEAVKQLRDQMLSGTPPEPKGTAPSGGNVTPQTQLRNINIPTPSKFDSTPETCRGFVTMHSYF